MVLTAGMLRKHRLEILKKVETQSASGATVRSWPASGRRIGANVKPISGRERIQGDGQLATATYTIRVHLNRDIAPEDRLRDQRGTVYRVISRVHDDIDRETTIEATEVVPA